MWIQHILEIIRKYQSKTPDNYKDFLDINLDLPFAKIMIELLKPKIIFARKGEKSRYDTSVSSDWKSSITFKGIDEDTDIGTRNPVKLRYYLQKTILDEISTEYFDEMEKGIVNNQTELHELLNRIMEKTNSEENINLLLNSISDIIMNDLFE